jgi:Icc-related predicted phosphoesterase
MKVLAVSDRVQEHIYSPAISTRYADVDIVFGCGDLPYYYLEYIVTMLPAPVLYVRGNHDEHPYHMSDGRAATHAEGCTDIHGRVLEQSGLLIAGVEGSMRYRPDGKCMYTDREMAFRLAAMAPMLLLNKIRCGRYLDVLVAHSPPYGIHDRYDLPHTGFESFLAFMRIFRPRYLLHGHVHDYNPNAVIQTRYYDTLVINVYPYEVLDIPLIGRKGKST